LKKSFLLLGAILDIIVISLILITALNVVNITNRVNSFILDNNIDDIYLKASDILDNMDKISQFYLYRNTNNLRDTKQPFTKDTFYTISLIDYTFIELDDNKTYTFIKMEDKVVYTTPKIAKVILIVKDKSDGVILSLYKFLYK
jgi:hypothetical protein